MGVPGNLKKQRPTVEVLREPYGGWLQKYSSNQAMEGNLSIVFLFCSLLSMRTFGRNVGELLTLEQVCRYMVLRLHTH